MAFVAGVLAAKNWDQIKVFLKPHLKELEAGGGEAYSALIIFLAQQKDKFSDIIAELKTMNEKKTKKKS